jgi:hypothetical protein
MHSESRLLEMVTTEIAEKERIVEALKVEIRVRQDDLLTAEAKLLALRSFRDAYPTLEMPTHHVSEAEAKPFAIGAQVERKPAPVTAAMPKPPKLSPKDFAAANTQMADPLQIEAWAAPRGVQFRGRQDLSAVNLKRRECGEKPFSLRGF